MKRLTLQDFKGKKVSEKSTKIVANLEFIKGGVEEYCHNGFGKSPSPGTNAACPGLNE